MFNGRVAIVTGGSRGIGRAIAGILSARGARVMLTSRRIESLEAAALTMSGEVEVFAANAGEPDQAERCIEACIDRFGSVDILVNNAATSPYWGALIDEDLATHDKTWRVNLRGPLAWTQLAWRSSMREHGGVVLNISSLGGFFNEPNAGSYTATKAALQHMTRHLAQELAPTVRVNCIAPGMVRTDMARSLVEGREAEYAKSIPLGRLGEPEDVGELAAFLVSDASAWITGQTFVVDGGLSVTGLRGLI